MTGKPDIGVEVILRQLVHMTEQSGVYCMRNAKGDALYVGKARNLKKRVTNYTQMDRLSIRIRIMVEQVASLEVTITRNEAEALLLEANLIKSLKPRYNILLKDDKSFPYIFINDDHDYPQITKYRGARTKKGSYFGPFASGFDVNRALADLQKAFLLRTCSDSTFKSRTRPCLEYQIKRCSAPCVNYISQQDYGQLVEDARAFLSGDNRSLQERLVAEMAKASNEMNYEDAAQLRDRIRALNTIQSRHDVNMAALKEADILGVAVEAGRFCVQVFMVRNGQTLGARAYFPVQTEEATEAEVLGVFIGRFYQTNPPPAQLLLSHDVEEPEVYQEALSKLAGRKVKLVVPKLGEKLRLVQLVRDNAKTALLARLKEDATETEMLARLEDVLEIAEPIERIAVFDNSHVMGQHAVGAMIVAGKGGFLKNNYRRYTIKHDAAAPTPTGGDDYGMMREVFTRLFSRLQKEDPERATDAWPSLVMIDGGQGQLNVAMEVLAELGVENMPLVAIAKGPDRNAGRERFFQPGREPFSLPMGDTLLFYLQRLRDEAHRYAIMSHRAKRSKALVHSTLDDVKGIGASRKKALLQHFGSVKAVAEADVDEIASVTGINRVTAQKIYDYFHSA